MNKDIKYLNAFNQISEIGVVSLNKIKKYFSNFKIAWQAPEKELKNTDLSSNMVDLILERRKKIDPDQEYEKVEKQKISMIDDNDEDYPKLLKQISNPPVILYFQGNINLINEKLLIAIVGSRRCSDYGKQVAFNLSNKLSNLGFIIISGLAIGIDAWAHQAVLENKGYAVAVLGTGLDLKSFYPKKNLKIKQAIIENNGLIISEYPIGTKGLRQHFPQRNRIISGLSLGVVVVEAKKNSGALITAKYAFKEKREVFAIPGQINILNSQGPNLLIKQGAFLVEDVNDIIKGLELTDYLNKNQKPLRGVFAATRSRFATGHDRQKEIDIENSTDEDLILYCLKEKPLHVDQIIKKVKIDIATLMGILAVLEIDKKIKNFGNGVYGII